MHATAPTTKPGPTASVAEAVVNHDHGDGRVEVRIADGDAGRRTLQPARVAMPGYRPTVGDRVIVQRGTSALYVVGVLRSAHGPVIRTEEGATATVEGAVLALRAADGVLLAAYDAARRSLTIASDTELVLRAGERVCIDTDTLAVNAGRALWAVGDWELKAVQLVERAKDTFRTAERILETRAGRARTIVDRLLELTARRTAILSEEDTRIDGKRVLLG